jgi:ABC-type nitrate/sulfonate/bicarbonate transport system substrate-binding protein
MLKQILCVIASFAYLIQSAHAQNMIQLRYGQNAAGAKGLSSLPLNVAIRKSFFVRQGIDLKVVNIKGGTDRIVAALDRGEIDAGKNATPYLVQAVLKGSDAVAVVAQTTNPVYSLIARPGIKTIADLKGKTVALSTPGDTITLSTTRLLGTKGLRPGDYIAKAVVGTPARFACLKSGECAAVPMGQPDDITALKQGYLRLAHTFDAGADLIFNVDMVRRAWGLKNKETVVRFVRAFASAYEFINNPNNYKEVIALTVELGGYSRELAGQAFEHYGDPKMKVLPRRGEIDMAAFARVLVLMAEAGVIPKTETSPGKFVDLQYLKAAGVQ